MILELKELFGNIFDKYFILEIAKVGALKKIAEDFMMMDIGAPVFGIPLMISGVINISRGNGNGEELLLYYL
ncbi:MAG: hypothetical protein CMC93_02695 [Flavobacteriaceae bacterium]|nr:hypothetical protein [Flavobacteriaceae bacterium]|tara:strand:- start:1054 stop:1269 length:216 start_codon:yes stop_codon:yes gene_type:complete